VLFVGDDWAEDHHDVEVQDGTGRRVAKARLPEGIAGITRFHELIGRFLDEGAVPDQVKIGIETDRGPWVAALVASGYQVYAINPLQSARAREGHGVSGAKSGACQMVCVSGGGPVWRSEDHVYGQWDRSAVVAAGVCG
jgi:hypothetical protein